MTVLNHFNFFKKWQIDHNKIKNPYVTIISPIFLPDMEALQLGTLHLPLLCFDWIVSLKNTLPSIGYEGST